MSRSLSVYATDFQAVVSAAGCGDRALLKELRRSDDSKELLAALEELVVRTDGAYSQPAEWLGFAQERLCEVYGRMLPNECVSAISLTRLEEIDAGFETTGLGLTLQGLMYGGGPLRQLPWPSDFPSTGRWPPEVIAPALELYERLAPTSDDPDVDALIVAVGDWLSVAAAQRHGLVGFYY